MTAVYILCLGLIQDLVKVPVYAQYLFQADQAVSDSKGLNVNMHYNSHLFMARRAIPTIAFPRVRTIYIYNYNII